MSIKFLRILLFFTISILEITNVLAGSRNTFLSDSAHDTLRISIKDAILMALERNPSFSIQRLEPKIAGTNVSEQFATYEPKLNFVGNKSKNKSQRFLGSRPDPFELTTDRYQYDITLTQALPTGTTVAANASIAGTLSNIYQDQFSGGYEFTITQALLRGFGFGANLANIRRAKIDLEISNAELKSYAENLVADVENAYWTLLLTAQEINIRKRSLELAQRQLKESEERLAVGKLPVLELAAVHAEVATRQEALIDVQSRYEQARLQLLFLLNPAEQASWSTIPIPLDQPLIPLDSLDAVTSHETIALKYRSDLKQAQLMMRMGEIEISRTKNGLLPQLDFFITLGRTSYATAFKDGLPDLKSPFYDIIMGVNFEFPVINQRARAQSRRAVYSREQMELSLKNMERLIQRDVRSAYIEVIRSRQLIIATRVTRELQDKKLEAEQEKFRVGKSTNYLVLQAQRDFISSQLDEARSTVEHLNALINLYVMEGTLLERRGINAISETE